MESSYYIDQQAMIWNLWVGSQSHKCGCLYATNPREKEFVNSEPECGCIIKLLLEVAINLELNLIVKLWFSTVDLFYLKDS